MRKHQSSFYLVFAIYVIAGIAAIVLFYNHGSRLSRQLDEQVLAQTEASNDLIVSEAEPEPEPVVEPEVVAEPEVITEPEPTEPEVIAEPEPTEPEVIAEPEPEIEADPEAEAEPEPEIEADPEAEAEPEAEPEPEKIYYGFTVKAGKSSVRVRKSTDRNSSIVGRLNGGDTGYVVEEDGSRTKIVLEDGTVGYVYNEYITVSEIPIDDVPEEYR